MRFAAISTVGSLGAMVLLAGCSRLTPALPRDSYAVRPERSVMEQILHSFGPYDSGGLRPSTLVDAGGTLYGTVLNGTGPCSSEGSGGGCGAIFTIDASGEERLLYNFQGSPDGQLIVATFTPPALIDVGGTLYGTTPVGGTSSCKYQYGLAGCGTVYKIRPSGREKVIYRFGGPPDGAGPESLIEAGGTFYGATLAGGSGNGTVYEIGASGKEEVIYRFKGAPDGAYPVSLIDVNGTLYGTTSAGGTDGAGTVFKITASGHERVLHSFTGSPYDGANPVRLVEVKDKLIGETFYGGSSSNFYCRYYGGCGTVFSMSFAGKEKILYNFAGPGDGMNPIGSLSYVNGKIYGTTFTGGQAPAGCSFTPGCGTVFQLTLSGKEKIVYFFQGTPYDGSFPANGVIDANGTLLGTTDQGGAYGKIGGTVFLISGI